MILFHYDYQMIRLWGGAVLFVVVAATNTQLKESDSFGLFIFKLLVFVLGLATAIGELALYVISFRVASVV